MAKKNPTATERKHLATIASMDCSCCEFPGPSHVHHPREGQGMAQRSSHWLAIPLCPNCHQGVNGIHGDRAMMRIYDLSELDMLAKTIEKLLSQ